MRKIVYIRNTKSQNLLRVGIADSEELCRNRTDSFDVQEYKISAVVYASLSHPAVGDEIDDYAFSEIIYADEQYRAEKKALSLLALVDQNERTLVRKLLAYGIRGEIAREVTERMVSLGYIDEVRQLERLVLSEAKAYRGPARILAKLSAKGYAASDIKRAIHSLTESGEVDFSAMAKELVSKKLPPDASIDDRKKLLYKHGYKIC